LFLLLWSLAADLLSELVRLVIGGCSPLLFSGSSLVLLLIRAGAGEQLLSSALLVTHTHWEN
jgi:hypothetical protein